MTLRENISSRLRLAAACAAVGSATVYSYRLHHSQLTVIELLRLCLFLGMRYFTMFFDRLLDILNTFYRRTY